MAVLNLTTAKSFRQYSAVEGKNHPPIHPLWQHDPPTGDAVSPTDTPTFTAVAATNLITSVAHGLVVNAPIRVASTTTLPGGLAAATTYYVIASGLTVDAFKVSATVGGTEIDITGTGTGTHSWSRYLTTGSPVAVTVYPVTNLFTSAAHGLTANSPVRFTALSLPSGLIFSATYYVIASGLTADAFKVSATVGGSEIDILDTGKGTLYFTSSEQSEVNTWLTYASHASTIAGLTAQTLSAQNAYAALSANAKIMADAYIAYWTNPAHLAWVIDDHLERYHQWIWRSADHQDAAQAAIPPSSVDTGIGSGAPASPANTSPN